jgi:hypothetical protein
MLILFYKRKSMADEKAPPSKPGKFSDPKQMLTLVAALTALVTALTSLVKAVDKSVEQASYETLSAHIVELQEDNAAMHRTLEALHSVTTTKAADLPIPWSMAVEPLPTASTASSSAPPAPLASGAPWPKSKHPSTALPVSASKCPVGDPLCGDGDVLPPKPPLPPRPPMAKPAPWKDVKHRADAF